MALGTLPPSASHAAPAAPKGLAMAITPSPGAGPREEAALPRDLVRALAWARGHLAGPVRLRDLALAAGVSERTLEQHFARFLGKTPLEWIRDARLDRARRALQSPGRGETVSAVAAAAGFTELGRFAARYAARFGERPSETLRRARAPRAGAEAEVDDEARRLTWWSLQEAFAVAPDPCRRALEAADEAQSLAPGYGLPKALAAWCWGQRAAHHFGATPAQDVGRALRLAEEAARLAPNEPLTLTLASGAFTLAHRLDEAARLLDRALLLDPTSPWAWARRAWASAYAGDAPAAIRQFATTLHLMPFEPIRHLAFIGMGCAHFVAGHDARAARWALAGCEASPGSFWGARVAAAAAAHAGARAEARRLVRELLRQDPDLTAAVARRAWPFPPRVMERLAAGLVLAGLPAR